MVSIKFVLRGTYGKRSCEREVAVLKAYFDDSGTHDGSPILVLGGLLGNEEQWDSFESQWNAKLQNPCRNKPPIKAFHSYDLIHKLGEFKSYNQAEIDAVNHDFRKIIMNNGLFGVAVAINLDAWKSLISISNLLNAIFGPAEGCAFSNCLKLLFDIIRVKNLPDKIFVWFDEGTEDQFQDWAKLYCSQKKEYPNLNGIAFSPVNETPGLQGADMIAYQTYQYAQLWLQDSFKAPEKTNAHFKDYLMNHAHLSSAIIIDERHIADMVNSIDVS